MVMVWTWQRFEDLGVHGLYDALALRCRVFILEQGAFQDPDGIDQHCWHLLGRDAAGTLQAYLRAPDPGVKYAEPSIGRIITSPESRGTGLGRLLVAQGIQRTVGAWPQACTTQGIRISAQARLRRFYAEFGFADVGPEYGEDGIPHQEMLRVGGWP
jgi:ElaA protein